MTSLQKTIQPELVLREYFTTNKQIIRKDNNLFFGDKIILKIDTPTPFIQKSTQKYYTIGAIWYYLKYKDEQLNIYINQCRKEKVESVSSLDKNELKSFFVNGVDDVSIYCKDKIDSMKIILGDEKELVEETNLQKPVVQKVDFKSNVINNNDLALKEDPALEIMNIVFSKESSKNYDRNSIIKNPSIKFENLLSLTRRTFMKDKNNTNELQNKQEILKKLEKSTFLGELINDDGKFI